MGADRVERHVSGVLRRAGACFALLDGARSPGTGANQHSTGHAVPCRVAAWWGPDAATPAPTPWSVDLPPGVDLLVLDDAPLWLAGRVAMRGLPLFEVDTAARARWQVEVRWRYLQVLPGQRVPDAARRWALAERPLVARTA